MSESLDHYPPATTDSEPTFADVQRASPVVLRWLRPTLLNEWPLLGQTLGFRYFLKHENHQPVGAFKVRGGLFLFDQLAPADRRHGVIACSTGNHGQSLAYAARLYGSRARIVVPRQANPLKLAAMRGWGAEVIEQGADFEEAKAHCERLATVKGWRYVHSANEPHLIAGVGTMALEIFEQLPDPDVILAPIGLGSGVCGTALVAANCNPRTLVIGVQAAGASAVAESWQSGQMIQHGRVDTIADGLATRNPAEMTLTIMRRLVREIVLVSDDEMLAAMRLIARLTGNLAEPAGAATTAAAWKLRQRLAGQKVVGVLSGGNCHPNLFRLLATEP